MKSFLQFLLGVLIGGVVALMTTPAPQAKVDCETYQVSRKMVTAYVLKPPPSEIIYKACPQVTEHVEQIDTSEKRVEETPKNEHEPRRHRRHRVRRYWR